MDKKELFINDNVIIPDYIKSMSLEEIETEIARLEAEAAKEKQMILKNMKKV